MENPIKTKVPPDGGYGWVIALVMGITTAIYIPMVHCFGLIFKDTFAELGLSGAQISLIVNLHAAFGMIMGLLNGVLVKKFGYRKIAFLAATLYFAGISLTSLPPSFFNFIFFYGLIASLGLGMCRSSYSLAINTYFKKRRSKAMSFAVTVNALGSIILPQLINFLMKFYTPQGVVLILGGLCAHFYATALLLHPVKWYMKEELIIIEEENPRIEDENQYQDSEIYDSHLTLNEEPQHKSFLSNIMSFFDLDLLKDPIFVNILAGLGLAVFSEQNFNVLTPFILNEFGLSNDQIATFMSTAAFTDIAFRLFAPYIGEYLKKSARFMFLVTLVVLIAMRFVLLFSSSFFMLLVSATGLGMARGIRRVYIGLIIPSHVSLEKLPSASGMEMMSNGLSILGGGSILGLVRDLTGSYFACIVIVNCVTFLPIILWTLESVILKYSKKKEEEVCASGEDHPLNKI